MAQNPGFDSYGEFFKVVLKFLSHEGIRHAGIFNLRRALSIPGLNNKKASRLLASVWYELEEGSPKIFFKTEIGQRSSYDLSEIPFQDCDQISIFPANPERAKSTTFCDATALQREIISVLNGKERLITFKFDSTIYIPELSLVPATSFDAYAKIEKTGASGKASGLVLSSTAARNIPQGIEIIPYKLCTGFTRLQKDKNSF